MSEIEKEIADFKARMAEKFDLFPQVIVEPFPVKDWPKIGDMYWFVDEYGETDYYVFRGNNTDTKLMSADNMYRTEAEADAVAVEVRKAYRRNA